MQFINYKKENYIKMKEQSRGIFVITFIILILLLAFFIIILKVRIWTYQEYMAIIIDDNYLSISGTRKSLNSLLENNEFYIQGNSIQYEIIEKSEVNGIWLYLIKINKKIVSEEFVNITVKTKQQTIFQIIINNWRKE